MTGGIVIRQGPEGRKILAKDPMDGDDNIPRNPDGLYVEAESVSVCVCKCTCGSYSSSISNSDSDDTIVCNKNYRTYLRYPTLNKLPTIPQTVQSPQRCGRPVSEE